MSLEQDRKIYHILSTNAMADVRPSVARWREIYNQNLAQEIPQGDNRQITTVATWRKLYEQSLFDRKVQPLPRRMRRKSIRHTRKSA